MTLIKTSLLSGIAVGIKMLTLLGLNKILAFYVGPAGYASLGQFQNAIQMITTLASGAINTGVTKYTAEYHDDEISQHAIWRTAGTISICGSILFALVLIAYNETLARWFLKDPKFGTTFIWFASTLVMFVLNTLLLAILNGKKEIPRYVTANIAGSLFALIVTTAMSMQLGLYGALVALATYQSLSFFVTFALISKTGWFKPSYLFGHIDKKATKNLAKFTIMALASAICLPLCHIMIRNNLGETLGWSMAGYWEAMWRLSTAYLMLVTSTLGVYYLPKLSELKNPTDIKNEIMSGYKILLPTTIVFGITIYLFRDLIIRLLFTAEFAEMELLFGWQITGDILKICSWLLSYVVLAKAFISVYIFSEIFVSITFYTLTCLLTSSFGLEGAAISHTITYFLYLIFMAIALKMKKII